MQLLHIADLHFGRLLYGRSLMDDQRHFVRQSLLPALDEYKPDALLIAGDLYDRQIASVDAIHLFDELIDALCERSIPAVIISGNHDSPDRIAVGKACLRGTASISSRSLKTRLRRSRSATYRFSRCRTLKTPRCAIF